MKKQQSTELPEGNPRGRPPIYTAEQRAAAKVESRRRYRKRLTEEKKMLTPEQYAALETKPVGRPPKRTAVEVRGAIAQGRFAYRDRLADEIAAAAAAAETVRKQLTAIAESFSQRLEKVAVALDEAADGGNAKAMSKAVKAQLAAVREAGAELSGKVPELAARSALEEGEVLARLVRYARKG